MKTFKKINEIDTDMEQRMNCFKMKHTSLVMTEECSEDDVSPSLKHFNTLFNFKHERFSKHLYSTFAPSFTQTRDVYLRDIFMLIMDMNVYNYIK